MRQTRRWLAAALLVAPLLFAAGADVVQAGTTLTGTIRGVVADENGDPLPGVTVIFRSESLIRERASLTDADGNYFTPGLAPGYYTVVAQLDGFTTVQQTTEVVVDEVTRIDFTMQEGEISETVTVVATKPVVDKTATDTGVVLNKDFTENVPVARSYQNLLQFAPGTTGGSNPNMLGGTSNSNTYQVDGVSTNDSVTGTFGSNINYDTIETVDIKLTGVSAEYGGFQGGFANVITKSGGNNFTGSIRDQVDSPSWEKTYNQKAIDEIERGGGTEDRDTLQDKQITHSVEGAIGGPIVRDSAWFYVSYSRDDTVRGEFLTNPLGGPFMDGQYVRNFQGDNSLAKLTYQVVNNHKLQYTYSEDPANLPRCYGQLFFGGACYDFYNVDFQNQGGFFWTGNWNGIWGNRALSDVKISHWENAFQLVPADTNPLDPASSPFVFQSPGGLGSGPGAGHPATIDTSTGVLFDGTVFSDDGDNRVRDQVEAKVTLFYDTGVGTHTIKIGGDYQEQERTGASFLSGNALIYLADGNGDGTGFVQAPLGLNQPGDPIGDAFDINNREYYLFIDFAPPGSGGPLTESTALYVQDDWTLNEKWSFNLGLRFEKYENTNDVNEQVFDQTAVAPRLGAAFDVTGEGKHVVKATAGRYLDSIELTSISPFVRAAGGQSAYDVYVNTNFPNPGTPTWGLLFGVRPDANSALFADDLKPQFIDELTLSYEYQISPTMGIRALGVYREWDEILGQVFSFSFPGGSPNQIINFDNRDFLERDYNAVTITFDKRFANNWELLANYTNQKSEGNVTTDSGLQNSQIAFGAYPGVPQATLNKTGELPWSVNQTANVQGAYTLPINSRRHSLSLGGRFSFREGERYSASGTQAVVVGPGPDGVQDVPLGSISAGGSDDNSANISTFIEERGIRREPNFARFDLLARWRFHFNKRVDFETRFEIFNVTDEQRADEVVESCGGGATFTCGQNFGFPTGYGDFQTPRNFEFSFAVLW